VLKKISLISIASLWWLTGPLMTSAWAQAAAEAAPKDPVDAGDTAFMLVSAALVLLMTPGLAFFYGGLVRSRNVLNTMMMSLLLMGIVGVTWTLWGYSLAFDNPIDAVATKAAGIVKFNLKAVNPYIGGLSWFGLNGVSDSVPVEYAGTIPHQLFMVYQMMFAIITPALISGAIVERMSFKAYFWFVILWSTFIYAPLAHWVWGKGWLATMGALDFAGGNVVHISSGVSAAMAAWVIGPRKTFKTQPAAPHNVPFVLIGIGLLWFGWFGFNGGSGFGAKGAVIPFVTTMIASASAGLMWLILEWVLRQKPTAVGIASGFLAGLVGITPCAGYVSPLAALLVGAITSTVCFFGVSLRAKLQFDDSLDAFPIHGLGGTVGAILTGIFASKQYYKIMGEDGKTPINLGLMDGNAGQITTQLISIVATYAFAAIGTFVILKALSLVMPLRAREEAEYQGLDISEHGEEGYGEEFASGLSFADKE
jgi:ammonium transporter, Amt family